VARRPKSGRAARQQRSKPVIEALKPWFEDSLAKMSKGSKLPEAFAYDLNHWDGLCRFLEDGGPDKEKRTVRRPRSRRGRMGHDCFASRNVQTQCRRSPGLDHRRSHQACQPLAGVPHRRTDALGLRCKARINHRQRAADRPLTIEPLVRNYISAQISIVRHLLMAYPKVCAGTSPTAAFRKNFKPSQ
jgi:hypothetical protein